MEERLMTRRVSGGCKRKGVGTFCKSYIASIQRALSRNLHPVSHDIEAETMPALLRAGPIVFQQDRDGPTIPGESQLW
jgi:hypothetical protein